MFWFNPGGEESLVGARPNPSRATLEIERDLALLPAYLARREDVVMMPSMPATDFLAGLLDAGLELPELVTLERIPEIRKRKIHGIRPWAHTPDAESLIQKMGVDAAPVSRDLFSKASHADFLKKLIEGHSCSFLCKPDCVGAQVSSVEEIESWVANSAYPFCVLKAPFSTAGRERVICNLYIKQTIFNIK